MGKNEDYRRSLLSTLTVADLLGQDPLRELNSDCGHQSAYSTAILINVNSEVWTDA